MKTYETLSFLLQNFKNLAGVDLRIVTPYKNNKMDDYLEAAPSVLVSYLYNRFNSLNIKKELSQRQLVHLQYSLGLEIMYIPIDKDNYIVAGPFSSNFLSADEIENRLLNAGLTITPALYHFFASSLPVLPTDKKEALLQLLFYSFDIPEEYQKKLLLYVPAENNIYSECNKLLAFAEHEKMFYRYKESLAIAKYVSEGDYTKCMEVLKTALAYQIPHQYSHDDLLNETITAARVGSLFYFAAIKGGLPPLEAEQIYTKSIHDILCAENTDSVRTINRSMLYNFCNAVKNNSTNHYSTFVQKIANYLSLNGSDELKLDELSDIFKKPIHLLEKEFRKETGFTIKQYHRKVKLQLAAALLQETNLPVHQIALQTGFLDSNYFSRLFKQCYNCSPSDYRSISASF